MSCRTIALAGIARDCLTNRGGIKYILLADYNDVSAVTVASGVVTGITMVTGKKFYRYDLRKEVGSLTSTPTLDASNGVAFVTSVIAGRLARMNASKRIEMNSLLLGNLAAIVVDNNDERWYVGLDEPVEMSGGESGTGTAYTDGNGYGFELTHVSNEFPPTISSTVDLDDLV